MEGPLCIIVGHRKGALYEIAFHGGGEGRGGCV